MEQNFFDPQYMNIKKIQKLEQNKFLIIGTDNGVDYWQAIAKKIKPIIIINNYFNLEVQYKYKKEFAKISKDHIDWCDGNRWYKLRH